MAIVLLSQKQWSKNKKKLVEPKDYIIMDGTEDDDAKLSAFSNVITADSYALPQRLLKMADYDVDSNEIIDYDKLEELESNFFDGTSLKNIILATVANVVGNDMNIFIVIRNKAFKMYKKSYKKAFNKLFDPNELGYSVLTVFTGDMKDIKGDLNKSLSERERKLLSEKVAEREEEMRKKFEKQKKKKNKKKKK